MEFAGRDLRLRRGTLQAAENGIFEFDAAIAGLDVVAGATLTNAKYTAFVIADDGGGARLTTIDTEKVLGHCLLILRFPTID